MMKRTLPHLRIGIYAIINIVFFFITTSLFASNQKSSIQLELEINNTDVVFTVYPATNPGVNPRINRSSNDLVVWLPSEFGLPDSVFTLAQSLSRNYSKTDVWVADLLSSLFLPTQASSINLVPDEILSKLIKTIHDKTQKRIFIVSSGKGALLAMRASHFWLRKSLSAKQFGGLILLSPNLFTKTPEPGFKAEYDPVTFAVNVPVFILQPENSPWRWQLATLQQHLLDANAIPYISIIPKVRDRFFFRPDATKAEQLASQELAARIQKSLLYLSSEQISRYATPARLQSTTKIKPVKKQSSLKVYKKDPTPPALRLITLSNQQATLKQYRGKVVVVNFWASWCPPCVHEMPSMERLYQQYPRSDFTILAVNMAEDRQTITNFLQNRVTVSFPILLDQNGKALHDWRVFAFPSSYIIGKQGKIRYALFGSIAWDTPEVIEIIDKLIEEPVNSN